MAKDLNHPIGVKPCKYCGLTIDIYSNAQKYCSREDNPECDDDRWLQSLWEKGRHPLQINHPSNR